MFDKCLLKDDYCLINVMLAVQTRVFKQSLENVHVCSHYHIKLCLLFFHYTCTVLKMVIYCLKFSWFLLFRTNSSSVWPYLLPSVQQKSIVKLCFVFELLRQNCHPNSTCIQIQVLFGHSESLVVKALRIPCSLAGKIRPSAFFFFLYK